MLQTSGSMFPGSSVAATVGVYPTIPEGTWRIEVVAEMDQPGALGYHADDHHQPFAKVLYQEGQWSVTASHELCEMLGDPWGNRLHGAAALPDWEGTSKRVRYLLELCDPCEAFTYQVGGVDMSESGGTVKVQSHKLFGFDNYADAALVYLVLANIETADYLADLVCCHQ